MKTKSSVYKAHLDFRGKICEKKCALYTGKYGNVGNRLQHWYYPTHFSSTQIDCWKTRPMA